HSDMLIYLSLICVCHRFLLAFPTRRSSDLVTYPGAQSGLSRQISIGKRALSIQVTEGMAVSRLLKPGDRIDILTLVDYAAGKKRSEEHTSELQSRENLVCRLLLEKKKYLSK